MKSNRARAGFSRREFLASSLALAAGCSSISPGGAYEIIDTHTHFYDPARPQGVPWPEKNDAILYRTVLPAEYIAMAKPLGIRGTVVVEASPWVADNQWVLELAQKEPFLLGLVGHLKPGVPEFANDLKRFAANSHFRGIRTGGWSIPVQPRKTDFVHDLGLLAERGLALDVLGGPDQLLAIDRLAEQLPRLKIVIDHCAGVRIDGKSPDANWLSGIKAVAKRRAVHMKVSGLAEGTGQTGTAPSDTEFYRPVLDILWNEFGEDRVIFGSNWPVSARFANLGTVVKIVQVYFEAKGHAAAEKYFQRNAQQVYGVA